jgi:hypothetical protein
MVRIRIPAVFGSGSDPSLTLGNSGHAGDACPVGDGFFTPQKRCEALARTRRI